jgi:hypothetical protein
MQSVKFEGFRLGIVNKFLVILVPARSFTDKALGPPTSLSLVAVSPGPDLGRTAAALYKAVLATRGCPGLSPVANVGDLAHTRKQQRHDVLCPVMQSSTDALHYESTNPQQISSDLDVGSFLISRSCPITKTACFPSSFPQEDSKA